MSIDIQFYGGATSKRPRRNEEKESKLWAIRRRFESVGPTLRKNPLGAGWGLLPTLRWVGCWLPTYLTSLLCQVKVPHQRCL